MTDTPQPIIVSESVKKAVLDPALMPICSCEDYGRPDLTPTQFDEDGKVRHGKINPKDIGMCQINEHFNGATAEAHGWDIYTLDGNIRMANWMYKHQGTKPWNWSKSCWNS